MRNILQRIPLASTAFLAYAIVGAVMLFENTLEYGAFADNLLKIGIACGVLGVPRAIAKARSGVRSINLLGIVEAMPIPSLVFVIFLLASSVSLAAGTIEFGAFSDNIMKVGIACGVIGAARLAEGTFAIGASRVSA